MCIACAHAHTFTKYFLSLQRHQLLALWMFRRSFPSATIPPKMHMLEDHTMKCVRARNVGFGLLGEQGAETMHDSTA